MSVLDKPCCHGREVAEPCKKCDELYTCIGARYDLERSLKFLDKRIKELSQPKDKEE